MFVLTHHPREPLEMEGGTTEFELHLVPVLLGDGEQLPDHVGDLKVEQVRAIEAPGVTHIKYRVLKGGTGRPA